MKTMFHKQTTPTKGIYVLAISVSKNINVKIGSLGKLSFRKGFYAYIGSAQNHLEKRLNRHLKRVAKRKFWHIDYLLTENFVQVVRAFYKEANKPEECATARSFSAVGFPVKGFGCSDCDCQSHLFLFNDYSLLENTCLKLGFKCFTLSVNLCIEKYPKPEEFRVS